MRAPPPREAAPLSVQLMVRVSPLDHVRLQRMADDEGRSVSAIARILMGEAIAARSLARARRGRGAAR